MPEGIAAEKRSYTGQFLKELLGRRPGKGRRQSENTPRSYEPQKFSDSTEVTFIHTSVTHAIIAPP